MDVVIVGAGLAGLAAADRMNKDGLEVCILEACEQPGGRVRTVDSGFPGAPFELGAEFIHGKRNITWDFLSRAKLTAQPVGQKQWIFDNSGLRPEDGESSEAMDGLNSAKLKGQDLSLEEYLKTRPVRHEWLLRQYVEGFFGADPKRVSMKWIQASQAEDEESFRIEGGYGRLVQWFANHLAKRGVSIHFNTVADAVRWRKNRVDVVAQAPEGQRSFHAHQVLVTVPLGVLKAPSGALGAIRFDPAIRSRETPLAGLEMGKVIRVQLRFEEPFWTDMVGSGDFGFVYSRTGLLRTWWPAGSAPVLTGWTGGVNGLGTVDIIEAAVKDLCAIFDRRPRELKQLLRDWRFHDWRTDPFSRGCYTYTTVGNMHSPSKLARPRLGTLFFAGEALVEGGPQGTVHGALDSGVNAAERLYSALS